MAYNFLGLVNDINSRLNEVPLTSANFASATGFYYAAKDAVNSSIRTINHQQYEWPFNHVTAEETVTAGVVRYQFPTEMKTVNMDSFRLKRDDALNVESRKLLPYDYEEYLERYVDAEYNTTDTGIRGVPYIVFRAPSQEYGLYPPPNAAYTVIYEYYRLPFDLILFDDVPNIPEQFRHVIVEGAMYHAYLFRGDTENAALSLQRFDAGIKNMRSLLINRYEYMRGTMVLRNPVGVTTVRLG